MSELVKWHRDVVGGKVVKALEKNNFTASYVTTRQEALAKLLELIPGEASIGFGGSVTLEQVGIVAKLEERGNPVLSWAKPGISPQESIAIRRKQLLSDVYLTGTNAVTLDGKLVNVDGTGNRVAAMTFGPEKVFVVVGVNKVVTDVAEAENRVRLWASPPNNKRLGYANPCAQTGVCVDCQGTSRICNVTTIMHKRPRVTDIHVIVVGEDLGL
ncbi:MAG TPA: lactate utilization protein [Patescibacteria group bacterium]|nr:lactate utilization protein [Patescibacteria group bacterium]